MGKAIQDARVKVGGQAGPMGQGQGVPLTQAVGQGGLKSAMDGQPLGPNSQVPGAKGLLDRANSTGRVGGLFSGVANKLQNKMQDSKEGLWGKTLFGRMGLGNNKQFNQLLKQKLGGVPEQGKPKGGFFQQVADRKQQLQQQRAGQPGFFKQVADRKQQLGGAPGQHKT